MNVFLEALIVGVGLVVVVWVVQKLGFSKWTTLFLSGVVFHLAAEVTGVNAAYVRTKTSI